MLHNSGFLVVSYGYLICEVFVICMFFALFGELYKHVHKIMVLSLNGWWMKLASPKDLWTHMSSNIFVKSISVNLCPVLNWGHFFQNLGPKHQQGANLKVGVC